MAKTLGHDYVVLDLYKGINKQLEYMQRDALTRIIEISLTFNGKRFSVEESDVEFHATRPSGLISYLGMEVVDAVNGVVRVTLTNQMLSEVGKLKCEVVVRGANKSKISFPVFTPIVKESTFADGTIISSDEFNKLEEALDTLNVHILIPHVTYRVVTKALATDKDELIVTHDDKAIESATSINNIYRATQQMLIDTVKIPDLKEVVPTQNDLLVIESPVGTSSTKVSDLLNPITTEINQLKIDGIKYTKI